MIYLPALHHDYADDDALSAAERRKSYVKSLKSGKNSSLDEPNMRDQPRSMKSSASESHLNSSSDSFLSPPGQSGGRAGSKLSLLADKVLDKGIKTPAVKQPKPKKEGKGVRNFFKKGKSRDPSPNATGRSRSTEYGSSARTGHLDKKKPSIFSFFFSN